MSSYKGFFLTNKGPTTAVSRLQYDFIILMATDYIKEKRKWRHAKGFPLVSFCVG